MATISETCSWCHVVNTLVPGVRNLCRHCGHRADRCRLECDCPKCAGLFSPSREGWADGDFAKAIHSAREVFDMARPGSNVVPKGPTDQTNLEGGAK